MEATMFSDFERYTFPEAECTEQDAREPEVFNASAIYLCVLVNDQWPQECQLRHLRPYKVVVASEQRVYYGWVSLSGQNTVDHIDHCIHFDRERVVAWKRVEADELVSFLPAGEWREDFGEGHVG